MKQQLLTKLGVDTGGTFTDFVLINQGKLQTHKVLSTPDAPEHAILQGINELGLAKAVSAGEVAIIHGSTVATNAALERKGVRTAFITNRGFRDMLTIARQTRPHLYHLETKPQQPPVPEELCLEIAASKAVNLLLSGPAGGLAAANYLANSLNIPGLMTFDMGGTSTDASLLDGGNILLSNEGSIGAFPVGVPMVDMHTIGAGGGSIAYLDAGSLLHVGPESAGARPGPACYGLGGTSATVTDANLLLGRLQPDSFMGGEFQLDYAAAKDAIKQLALKLALTIEETSEGIVSIANSHMAQALRSISVEKGYDPKQFRLCCFGGAGGLHICALADALGMTQAMIPVHAGVFSALGMLIAPVKRNSSHSYQRSLTHADENEIMQVFTELKAKALDELNQEQIASSEALIEYSADMRYSGQSSSLNLAWEGIEITKQKFHELHKIRYGHQLHTEPEIVNLRLSAQAQRQDFSIEPLTKPLPAQAPKKQALYGFDEKVSIYQRDQLNAHQIINGPALILENNSTTLIGTEWCARTDKFGHLFLDK